MLENDNSGFGKDYHGEDVFGGNIGGTNGGDGADRDSGFEAPDIDTNELSNTESSFEGEATSVGDSLRENIQGVNDETTENSNTGSAMDTSFQIGGIEENEASKEKMNNAKQKVDNLEQSLSIAEERRKEALGSIDKLTEGFNKDIEELGKGSSSTFEVEGAETVGVNYSPDFMDKLSKTASNVEKFAKDYGFGIDEETKAKMANPSTAAQAMRDVLKGVRDMHERMHTKAYDNIKSKYDDAKSEYESAKTEYDKQLESSFTDRMKETKKSDYETKANKDSTKEVPKETPKGTPKETPKETPSRNDFGNHAMDTLKGATDKLTNSFTANALGLKSIEDFARENGYNPEKLSTMRAYQAYQNKEIMKAIPGVLKQVGGYIVERIKDAFDPSQLPERVRNTLARYNVATLVGAAILSMNSGAGLQASLDQALTIVDPEDQNAVSDFLEDVLKDRDTVKDLSNAVDGALAPEENSNTSELDEEIVNIGRKNNKEYDDFNAGLGSSGTTTSDADVKVFIARNIKADPILRRMVEKMGK